MSEQLENKRILNISEAARYSGYSRGWIEHWLREGLLPYESPPGQGEGKQSRKFIRRADLDAFLESCYKRESLHYGKKPESTYVPGKVTLLPRIRVDRRSARNYRCNAAAMHYFPERR
ncbi:MAG TPA: helix-turn-helix domain-containing protein [archaeon]|nr:helix-turn-helix domain-containing protein [archaeon]